jgi:hypothetical protein
MLNFGTVFSSYTEAERSITRVQQKGKRMSPFVVKPLIVALALTFAGDVFAKPFIRGDVGRLGGKAKGTITNGVRETGNVLKHIDKEKNRAGVRAEDAVQVAGKTVERQAHSFDDNLKKADERLREGKPFDAVAGFARDNLKSTEQNMLKATQESSALRFFGSVAASTVGPWGTGLYNFWQVNGTTGDFGQALTSGLISGASTYGLGEIGKPPVEGLADAGSNAAASAAVGCVASGANGGDCEKGARNAAIASGALSFYKSQAGAGPDARPGGDPMSKGDGFTIKDFDPRANNLGKWNDNVAQSPWLISPAKEGSLLMRGVNQIPGMNALANFHDPWAVNARMGSFMEVATIPPAIVINYAALGAGVNAQHVKDATADAKERDKKQRD